MTHFGLSFIHCSVPISSWLSCLVWLVGDHSQSPCHHSSFPHHLESADGSYRELLFQRIIHLCRNDNYAAVTDFAWYFSFLFSFCFASSLSLSACLHCHCATSSLVLVVCSLSFCLSPAVFHFLFLPLPFPFPLPLPFPFHFLPSVLLFVSSPPLPPFLLRYVGTLVELTHISAGPSLVLLRSCLSIN